MILLGEHFMVHGEPVIVLAIDRRATVTAEPRKDKKVWIKSKSMKCSGYFKKPEHVYDVLEAIKHAGGEAFVTKMTPWKE